MPWYGLSLIAMVAESFYNVFFRKGQNLKIRDAKLLFYIFLGMFGAYLFLNLLYWKALVNLITGPKFWPFLLLGLGAAMCAFVGNLLDAYATARCPNAGYGKQIISLNVFPILIVSYLFLHSSLSLMGVIGMVLIAVGLFPFLKTQPGELKGEWRLPAIGAMFVIAGMYSIVNLMEKPPFKFAPAQVLLPITLFPMILYWIMSRKRAGESDQEIPIQSWGWVVVILVAFFSIVDNLANYMAYDLGPNAGYAQAIMQVSAFITMPLSLWLLPKEKGGEFNRQRWLGAALNLAGLVLLILFTK